MTGWTVIMYVTFDEWTKGRTVPALGTNAGANNLPFQDWRHFKEAFAPEIVARAVAESQIAVRRCFDPFGGSGTTALACQFLGIHPWTVEVNPFLADLIEAKLTSYDADAVARDLGSVIRRAKLERKSRSKPFEGLPPTFVEPGINNRWIFDRSVARRLSSLLTAIEATKNAEHRRLFKVLLGGILVDVSNVFVNGKGRRYRGNWITRKSNATDVDLKFYDAVQRAISDIHKFANRKIEAFNLIRGDSRKIFRQVGKFDLAVFSPPYPNSFDYTDVYNIELWLLGYLKDFKSNRVLRAATLSSHVQISRDFSVPPTESRLLNTVLRKLELEKHHLWDQRIPSMVGGYFSDLFMIIDRIQKKITPGGDAWIVVGDSCYAGIQIPTAKIIEQIAKARDWTVKGCEPFRSMRASPQQGGREKLAETLIVLTAAEPASC
jgi:DNA modification methylase